MSVPTVDALAFNLWGHRDVVCPLMDARRNQTYTGLYRFSEGKMSTIKQQCAVDIGTILSEINGMDEAVVFLGDGVPVFRDAIAEHCRVPYSFAPAHANKQRAGAVAALASLYYREGKIQRAQDHKPEYLRLSQAERERMEKIHG